MFHPTLKIKFTDSDNSQVGERFMSVFHDDSPSFVIDFTLGQVDPLNVLPNLVDKLIDVELHFSQILKLLKNLRNMQALYFVKSMFSSFFHALMVFIGKRKYLKFISSWVLKILWRKFFEAGGVKTTLAGSDGFSS